jgi:thiol-disulfide isomerase/thioredoxin
MRNRRIVSFVLLLLLVGAGLYQYRKYRVAPELSFDAVSVQTLDGKAFNLQNNTGKPRIIKFFATWCIDCRKELPKLVMLKSEFEKRNIDLILLSDEDLATLEPFAQFEELQYPLYKLPKPFKAYGIHTLPTTYVMDGNGKMIDTYTGSKTIDSDQLNAWFQNQ